MVSNVASRYSTVLERSRPVAKDAVWLVTRLIGFARKDVPVSLVDYLDEMLSDTPIEVIADFVPGVLAHDQTAALPALAGIPSLVLCGDSDRITPPSQSRFLADALPDAEFVLVERAGHLAMMEAPGGDQRRAAPAAAPRPGLRRRRIASLQDPPHPRPEQRMTSTVDLPTPAGHRRLRPPARCDARGR